MKNYTRQILKIVFMALAAITLANVNAVHAEDATCVSQYGGGVVCGRKTPDEPHAPVNAALGDINFGYVGAISLVASAGIYFYGRKKENGFTHISA